jgi:phage-related minor tail protein
MTLRTSLIIDGNAKGAVSATADAKAGVIDFGAAAKTVSKQVQDDWTGAYGSWQSAGANVSSQLKQTGADANAAAGHVGGLSTQAMALSHAMRGATEQIALGVPPSQALLGQLNHLTYAASGPGGLSAAFSQLGTMARGGLGWLAATVGVTGGVAAGIAAIGVAAVVAATQYGAAQRDMQLALSGTGRASGVVASQINAIAAQSASAFGESISQARDVATALASTGKIGREQVEQLTPLADQLGRIFGEDTASAGRRLAQAFADPAKGAADLNQRLGFLDAATLKLITDMQAQGKVADAQGILFAGLKRAIDESNVSISTTTQLWTALGNGISNAWDAFGAGVSRATGIGFTQGLDEKLDESKRKVAELEQQIADFGTKAGNLRPTQSLESLNRELDAEKQKLQQLQGEWQRYWDSVAAAQTRRDSFAQNQAIDQALPDAARLRTLQNNYMALALQMQQVNRTGGEASPILEANGRSYAELAKAVEQARGVVAAFQTTSQRAIAGLDAQIAAVGKRSPAALGQAAYQQTLASLGSNSPDAIAQADRARTLATKQAEQQLFDAQAQRLLAARQGVDTAQLELALVGKSSAEQDRQRGILQAKQQLEQEALQIQGNSADFDQKKLAALTAQIDKQSQLKQLLGEQNALNDARFERDQLSRTPEEQTIASRLRQVYGDSAYKGQLNGELAQTMRGTNEIAFNKDLFVGGLKDFNSQLQQTHSLSQAALGAVDHLLA